LNAARGPLEQTEHAQAGKAFLLGPKGMNILDDKGKSRYFKDKQPADLFGDGTKNDSGFFGALYSYRMKVGADEFTKEVKPAFGAQGARIATMYADLNLYKSPGDDPRPFLSFITARQMDARSFVVDPL